MTIHLLSEDGAYQVSPESRAFPGWRAEEIHAALNETTAFGANLRDPRAHRSRARRPRREPGRTTTRGCAHSAARSFKRGRFRGRAEGRAEGHAEGRTEGKAQGRMEGPGPGWLAAFCSRGASRSRTTSPPTCPAFAGASEDRIVTRRPRVRMRERLPHPSPPPRLLTAPALGWAQHTRRNCRRRSGEQPNSGPGRVVSLGLRTTTHGPRAVSGASVTPRRAGCSRGRPR